MATNDGIRGEAKELATALAEAVMRSTAVMEAEREADGPTHVGRQMALIAMGAQLSDLLDAVVDVYGVDVW